ncbi:MAG: DUF3781 domain-containing protein, partial [Spirochaetaceae bacterium]|nr:DUF3781 domain-containing protein [Spirochaetaceae bacterium]
MNDLIANTDKIHTTAMAVERISRNLNIDTVGLTAWCREKIKNADTVI